MYLFCNQIKETCRFKLLPLTSVVLAAEPYLYQTVFWLAPVGLYGLAGIQIRLLLSLSVYGVYNCNIPSPNKPSLKVCIFLENVQ